MQEEDIRPQRLFDRYLELCREDAEVCFAGVPRRDVPCVACGGTDTEPAFDKWGFAYRRCRDCGSLYVSPRPDPEAFQAFYVSSRSSDYWVKEFFPAVMEARREKLFRDKAGRLLDLCRQRGLSTGVIAEVGAGFGMLLEEIRAISPDSRLIAVEPNPDMAALCAAKGLCAVQAFGESLSGLADAGKVDLAVTLEVLEHVHEPQRFCSSVAGLLRPGGTAVFTTLCCSGFDIQVLWERSKSVSPPHHLNLMSLEGLGALMRRSGFATVECFTPGRLDVDIVRKFWTPEAGRGPDRFLSGLLAADEPTREAFQNFLAGNRLSSHCWVLATR
ncbi:MAG: class I SAM-dependent methyltransferase [Desulfovibrionaceae bacterium]|jgi:SAM-dependent methyltransferase